jgi:PilZ domain
VDSISMYVGAERRMNPRDWINRKGVIWRDDPYSIVICTVRDVSREGAGLSLPDGVSPLPAEFDLTFDRVTRRCIVVWQHLDRMGVKFRPT